MSKRIDDQGFMRMWRRGCKCVDIARHFGVSASEVTRARKRLGVPARASKNGKELIDRAKVEHLYQQHLSYETIAARLGCSKGSVQRIVSEEGFTRSRQQAPTPKAPPKEPLKRRVHETGGRYRDMALVADEFGIGLTQVQRIWHEVRA